MKYYCNKCGYFGDVKPSVRREQKKPDTPETVAEKCKHARMVLDAFIKVFGTGEISDNNKQQ